MTLFPATDRDMDFTKFLLLAAELPVQRTGDEERLSGFLVLRHQHEGIAANESIIARIGPDFILRFTHTGPDETENARMLRHVIRKLARVVTVIECHDERPLWMRDFLEKLARLMTCFTPAT